MIAAALDITPRAALRLVEELNLREMTGRGGFGRGECFKEMFVKWRTAEIDLAGPIEADTLSSQPNKLGTVSRPRSCINKSVKQEECLNVLERPFRVYPNFPYYSDVARHRRNCPIGWFTMFSENALRSQR